MIGAPKRLDSPQIRRSHSAAISSPPPTQMPWICATSGCRQAASAARGGVHDAAVVDRLRLVAALGREFRDVVAGRERLLAGAAQDHAAQAVVGGQRVDGRAQRVPHRFRQRVELFGAVQHDRRDRPVAVDCYQIAHRRILPDIEQRQSTPSIAIQVIRIKS